MGTFFVLPVYLQTVLGLDAFETGLKLFPLSVSMLIAALLGPRMAARRSPKRVAQVGLIGLALAATFLLATVDVELNETGFAVSLVVFGIGAGLLASQLGNVILSSVEQARSSEAGGLQGTAQNLGASLGTALIGAILLTGLTASFLESVAENPAVAPEVSAAVTAAVEDEGVDIIPVAQAETLLLAAGLPPAQATAVAADYASAQLDGLRNALGAIAFLAVLALWFTRKLPGHGELGAVEPAA
jgi:MFS family permease